MRGQIAACRVVLLTSNQPGWPALRETLAELGAVRVVGETGVAEHAERFAARWRPDVILADERVATGGLAALVERLARGAPESRIATLADHYDPGGRAGRAALTVRQLEILDLLSPCSNHQIAERLTTSENTVESRVREVYRRLGVHTRRAAMAWARQPGDGGTEGP